MPETKSGASGIFIKISQIGGGTALVSSTSPARSSLRSHAKEFGARFEKREAKHQSLVTSFLDYFRISKKTIIIARNGRPCHAQYGWHELDFVVFR